MALNPWFTLLGCLLVLLFLVLLFLGHQRRLVRQHRQRITTLEQELADLRAELDKAEAANREQQQFLDMLNSAEITTRLQKPRLLLGQDRAPDMPEKYHYVSRMIARGISREDICRILAVSAVEVEQLVTLARIGRHGAAGEEVKKYGGTVEE